MLLMIMLVLSAMSTGFLCQTNKSGDRPQILVIELSSGNYWDTAETLVTSLQEACSGMEIHHLVLGSTVGAEFESHWDPERHTLCMPENENARTTKLRACDGEDISGLLSEYTGIVVYDLARFEKSAESEKMVEWWEALAEWANPWLDNGGLGVAIDV